ncbi:HlyD family secretion protein [Pseudoalteromonas sp. NJ631]|uniref:HlyD family secretion protein n=1 Tax=Pseudoalteromonas sp. NJ631 TaxID=493915 RepID=UPI00030B1119|nr:HlyD family efflux transporter periplasmic adaptor subunit [Pseudoalteromonas sp. NJ631]
MKLKFKGSTKVDHPTQEHGIKIPYTGPKRVSYQFRWYLLLVIAFSPVCILAWFYLVPQFKVEAVGIVTSEPLVISAPSSGTVEKVEVLLGELVKQDQKLLELYNFELSGQYQEVNRQLLSLTQQKTPFTDDILSQLETRKTVAKHGVERQQDLLDKYKEYQKRGVVPVSNLASAVAALNAAELNLEQTKVDILREKERQDMERLYGLKGQRYQQLTIEFARLSALNQSLTVNTPFAGRVNDVFVQEGQYVVVNEPLFSVVTEKTVKVHGYLAPKYLEYSKIGQKAVVKLPNGKRFDAVINEYTELTSKIPPQLSGPFEGQKAALKLILKISLPAEYQIEGLPVTILFERQAVSRISDLWTKG